MRNVVGQLVWLSRLFEELTIPFPKPIAVYSDNQSALNIAGSPIVHERTKHIEVDCYFVRNMLQEGMISLHHILTGDQPADDLTKSLIGIKHPVVLRKLAVFSSPPT